MFAILPKGFRTEMIFGIKMETELFFYAVLLGAGMGVVYDVFRVVRRTFPHKNSVVFAEDVIYMLFGGFCYYIFVTELAWGQLRFFILLGEILGFVVEHFSVGNFCVKIISTVTSWIFNRIFACPIKLIVRNATKISRKFVQSSKSSAKNVKRKEKCLKDNENMLYNKEVSKSDERESFVFQDVVLKANE